MKDWKSVLMAPDVSIRSALYKIDKAATKIGLVVDQEYKLLGTVSDGDIRRAILSGLGLEEPIRKCMCVNPTTARNDESRESILSKMRNLVLHQIPILDATGIVVNLALIDDYLTCHERDNWVVIMAGGPGTRLKEITQNIPKPMLHVGNRPLLETMVHRLTDQGFSNIWLAVNHQAEIIENYFRDGSHLGVKIEYLREKKRLGTAGGLSLLPSIPDEPVLVTNADIVVNIDYGEVIDAHIFSGADATMVVRDHEYQIPYGVVKAVDGVIVELDEKPVHNVMVNAGIYVLSPSAISRIPNETFFDMTELFDSMIAEGLRTRPHCTDGYWCDIGRPEDLQKARSEFHETFQR